jgi:hypothetical protein
MQYSRRSSGFVSQACVIVGAAVAIAALPGFVARAQDARKKGKTATHRPADEVGKRYYVYDDSAEKFIPGGFMPDGRGVRMRLTMTEGGAREGKCFARLSYTLAQNDWVGVAFMLKNSFKPTEKFDMYKALGAKKGDPIVLRYYARSADGANAKFKVGGLDNDDGEAETAYMQFGPEWAMHQVDVSDLDLTSVHGALTVILDKVHNEELNRPVVSLDLDEIYFTKLKTRPKGEASEK